MPEELGTRPTYSSDFEIAAPGGGFAAHAGALRPRAAQPVAASTIRTRVMRSRYPLRREPVPGAHVDEHLAGRAALDRAMGSSHVIEVEAEERYAVLLADAERAAAHRRAD